MKVKCAYCDFRFTPDPNNTAIGTRVYAPESCGAHTQDEINRWHFTRSHLSNQHAIHAHIRELGPGAPVRWKADGSIGKVMKDGSILWDDGYRMSPIAQNDDDLEFLEAVA